MTTLLANSEHQTITIRVVFDGAAKAGKTTAVYSLADALGTKAGTYFYEADAHASDDQPSDEVAWFDWMTYDGGQHDGDPLHVELASTPGEQELRGQRQHLLSWGDVVVFLVDSSPDAFAASVEAFHDMRTGLGAGSDVPVVVLANKRDVDGALALQQMHGDLGLSESDLIIEAIGSSGEGIREAFIYAVRAALAMPVNPTESTTVEDLLADMQLAHESSREAELARETEPAAPAPLASVVLSEARLNADGLTNGAAVIMPSHWRMIVEVANGRTQLPLADGTEDAATAFELVSWGLVQGEEAVVFTDPEIVDEAETADEFAARLVLESSAQTDELQTEDTLDTEELDTDELQTEDTLDTQDTLDTGSDELDTEELQAEDTHDTEELDTEELDTDELQAKDTHDTEELDTQELDELLGETVLENSGLEEFLESYEPFDTATTQMEGSTPMPSRKQTREPQASTAS